MIKNFEWGPRIWLLSLRDYIFHDEDKEREKGRRRDRHVYTILKEISGKGAIFTSAA